MFVATKTVCPVPPVWGRLFSCRTPLRAHAHDIAHDNRARHRARHRASDARAIARAIAWDVTREDTGGGPRNGGGVPSQYLIDPLPLPIFPPTSLP